jgi:hypothetical protein
MSRLLVALLMLAIVACNGKPPPKEIPFSKDRLPPKKK